MPEYLRSGCASVGQHCATVVFSADPTVIPPHAGEE
jgi:hypothetical protein